MKIELSHDEISAVCRALLTRAQETARNALKCKVFGEENDAEFWQERAEEYRKAYETVEAQRGQAFKAYEQAAVGAGAGAEEEEVREMEDKARTHLTPLWQDRLLAVLAHKKALADEIVIEPNQPAELLAKYKKLNNMFDEIIDAEITC